MPILFYYGTDDYLIDQAAKSVVEIATTTAWGEFNLSRLDGSDPAVWNTALLHCTTPPFNGGQRTVLIRNATSLNTKFTDQAIATLETLLEQCEGALLLITYYGTLDNRLKAVKRLKDAAQVQTFDALAPWETEKLQHRVRSQSAQLDIRIDAKMVQVLTDAVGTNTRRLVSELQKLKAYDANELSPGLVRALVDCHTQRSHQVAEAVVNGDLGLGLKLLNELLDQHESPLKVLAGIIRPIHLWFTVKALSRSQDKAIADHAKINPYRVEHLRQEIAGVELGLLKRLLAELLRAEVAIKDGYEPRSTLELALIRGVGVA